MRAIGTYEFNVVGDGRSDEFAFTLRALRTPEPFIQGVMPTGILEARVGNSPGGVTATLEGDIIRLKFDIPPSSSKVTVDALFGSAYGEPPMGVIQP